MDSTSSRCGPRTGRTCRCSACPVSRPSRPDPCRGCRSWLNRSPRTRCARRSSRSSRGPGRARFRRSRSRSISSRRRAGSSASAHRGRRRSIDFRPRERGGTGRRAGLRILSRKGCGFDSRRSHLPVASNLHHSCAPAGAGLSGRPLPDLCRSAPARFSRAAGGEDSAAQVRESPHPEQHHGFGQQRGCSPVATHPVHRVGVVFFWPVWN